MADDLYLFPEDIDVVPEYQTRLWGGVRRIEGLISADPAENTIEGLAQSIVQIGQTDSGVVIRGPIAHRHVLIIGHRRREAIALANQWNADKGLPLMKMRVRLDRLGDPLQKAICSNWHLTNYSPMDKAAMIRRLRKLKNWWNRPGSEAIAKYLSISTASVIQYEKFLKAEPELQEALHSGAVAKDSAFDLIKATEVKAKAVLKLAAKIEAETQSLVRRSKHDSLPLAGRIRRPSILGAIDALRTNDPFKGPRKKRGEILRFFTDMDTEGFPNGERSVFIKLLCLWAQGSGDAIDVETAFKQMTKHADPGFRQKRGAGRPAGSQNRPKLNLRKIPPIERNQIDI